MPGMEILPYVSPAELSALATVILTDVVLAGDNAIVVGMAAAGLPAEHRRRAILAGIIAATVLRLLFAVMTSQLLRIVGLLLAGGLLLLWVAWKLFRELHKPGEEVQGEAALEGEQVGSYRPKRFRDAVTQIIVADVSMSLDNVLAASGAARVPWWSTSKPTRRYSFTALPRTNGRTSARRSSKRSSSLQPNYWGIPTRCCSKRSRPVN